MFAARLLPSVALAAFAATMAWLATAPPSQREVAANAVGYDDAEFVDEWVIVDAFGCATRCENNVAAEFPTCATTCPEDS